MNERSILILSNGKLLQIAQRRVAGAEVVHRDPHAELAQLVQHRERRLVVANEHGFSDLQLEPLRRQAATRPSALMTVCTRFSLLN